jgi:transposase InsO family protein
MPWKETHVLEERLKFITAYLEGGWSISELSHAFGVSRKTAYKYIARYSEQGVDGLKDFVRAPHSHPNQTSVLVERLIVAGRKQHMTWGSKKLLHWLGRHHPEIEFPARSTVGEILKRHQLVLPRRRIRRATPSASPLGAAKESNSLWCCDFKGWFKTLDGRRCDPLTVTDAFSRYALVCRGVPRPIYAHVRPCFERAFHEFGLPEAIRTDNGPPFASSGTAGLTKLSVWWIKLGIRPERIRPGRPQENGRHERFHRTLKQETARPPKATLQAQQRAFSRFVREYNEERPHEALDGRCPGEVYQPSTRTLPKHTGPFEYPKHFEVRTVRKDGRTRWQGKLLFITDLLVHEEVGFEPISDRHWILHWGPVELGVIDNAKNKLVQHENFSFTRRRADWDELG